MATRRTFLLGTGGAAAAGLVSVPALAEPRVERGGRPDPDLGRFTIAVIPDTQYLFDRDRGDSAPLDASLRYLLDHAASDNIVFISHLGDLTENGLKSEIEDIGRSFRVLDRRRVGYSVLAGNHDLDPRTDDQRGRTPYLDEFGPHRFRQSPTFRGASADGYNSFHVFKAAGREWLVLALDWRMSAKGFDLARDVIDVRTFSPWLLGKKSTNALERVEIERTGDVDRFSVPIDFARRFAGFAPVPVRPQRPVRDVVIEGTVAYWRYDSLKDLSGNGNDLRQVGTLAVADDHHADSPSHGSRVFGKNTDVTLVAAARQMFRPRCPWTWSPGGGCATAPACRTGVPNCCRRTSNRSAKDALEARRRLVGPIPERTADPVDETGTCSGVFLTTFVPIAALGTGDHLFVDLRPGRRHGCVQYWSRDDGSRVTPSWDNVTDMLTDIANALHTGSPALRSYVEQARPHGFRASPYVPTVEDRCLEWRRST